MKLYTIISLLLTAFIQTVLSEYDGRVITTLKYSRYSVTPTVVNGKPASKGEFPFLVSFKEPMQKFEPGKIIWKNLCGGSIIAKIKVLSAAHCFESDKFYYARNPGILRVVAGDRNTDIIHTGNTETTPDAQWRKPTKVILHQNFNFPTNDIALVMVDKPWVFNDKVNLVKIATKASDFYIDCVSAGYGTVGFGPSDIISPVLLRAKISTLPSWRCSMLWEMNMSAHICTSSAVTDVARGDSGGPLLCMHTGDPKERNNEGVLAGVVSGKNFDKTTLYTRVSAYSKWIARDGGAHKLRASMTECLAIILFVLIYLLFYWLPRGPRKILSRYAFFFRGLGTYF